MEKPKRDAVNRFLFVENQNYAKDWMRGQRNYSEIINLVSNGTGISEYEIRDSLIKDCRQMRIDHRIIGNIKAIRGMGRVVLITGNMDCFKLFTVNVLGLHDIFDDVMSSFDFGLLKTDRAGLLFEIAEARLGIPISDSCLIDDDVTTGMLFTQLGGHYIRVRNPEETARYTAGLIDLSV
ncbi:MAG: hypothetical protein RIB53_03715 [Roseitalea porphyridii]